MVLIQVVVLVVYWMVQLMHRVSDPGAVQATSMDGNLISVATWTSTPIVLALVFLLIRLRRYPWRDYLAWRLPAQRDALLAVGGLALLLTASDLVTHALGRPVVPPVMIDVYRSSWPPLLLLTLVVGAPLGEETLMRGFLFKGIASAWGPAAAIVLSALAWASLHIQYDPYEIAVIGLSGLYLGLVRYKTGSLPLLMALHALSNAVATAELVIKVHAS
jgi:membrane protease YdiL (CAAX protease family)